MHFRDSLDSLNGLEIPTNIWFPRFAVTYIHTGFGRSFWTLPNWAMANLLCTMVHGTCKIVQSVLDPYQKIIFVSSSLSEKIFVLIATLLLWCTHPPGKKKLFCLFPIKRHVTLPPIRTPHLEWLNWALNELFEYRRGDPYMAAERNFAHS